MRERAIATLTFVLLVLCLSGPLACSSIKSDSDYNPNIDFAGLKTYAWLPDQPQGHTRVLHTNGLRLDRVRTAIDQTLQTKGLHLTATTEADFLIRSLVTEELVPTGTPKGHSDTQAADPAEPEPKTRRSRRYENVALIVDFVEPRDQDLIWRGTGEKRVERNTTADVREAAIVALVTQILSSYPPDAP